MDQPSPKQILEALLFAAEEPLGEAELQDHLGGEVHVADLLDELQRDYAARGVRLERQERAWAFRTAPEVAPYLKRSRVQPKKLSRAALETLAIIAYHQPVTRAEIEALRGVAVGQGTLDILVEAGWVTPKGRREAPGRPVTWVTTQAFLDHFALASLDDLPRLDELEGASLFNPARGG
ncbi:SMC-Scp complex subunit ScpB [Benzoatithermus flavus]|uniref:SMC-Scp complex subunit ScpB n=1 Tax=Benzoatithermus flavus TaxID=3108223 RepID=A0ABU8XVK6_9PROT